MFLPFPRQDGRFSHRAGTKFGAREDRFPIMRNNVPVSCRLRGSSARLRTKAPVTSNVADARRFKGSVNAAAFFGLSNSHLKTFVLLQRREPVRRQAPTGWVTIDIDETDMK